MKNLFLSTIFAIVAFASNAQQIKIINVYETTTLIKDSLTNSYDAFYNQDSVSNIFTVSKRFILNFSDSTYIEYDNSEIVSVGKLDIVQYLVSTNTFLVLFVNENNSVKGINSFANTCLLFEQINNSTIIQNFENYIIY